MAAHIFLFKKPPFRISAQNPTNLTDIFGDVP